MTHNSRLLELDLVGVILICTFVGLDLVDGSECVISGDGGIDLIGDAICVSRLVDLCLVTFSTSVVTMFRILSRMSSQLLSIDFSAVAAEVGVGVLWNFVGIIG